MNPKVKRREPVSRAKKDRNAPEYYGNPVMICGVENANQEGERKVITISGDEN